MKKMMILPALLFALHLRAAVVDTVQIYSKAMKTTSKCLVIRPFIEGQRPLPLPVVYLLHGYSGDYSNWLTKVPRLREYADTYQVMIVCPDGGKSSWYLDSPVDATSKYETYIAREVPAFIDSAYYTIRHRRGRVITGLSMGGHGALYLAMKHPGVFGAAGSMSGGVDLRSSKNKFDISKRIGDTVRYAANWKKYSVLGVVEQYRQKDSLALIIDCGVSDFFYPDNRKLHQKMLELKIPHDYIERPGNHSWNYWANAVEFQLLFFRKFFRERSGGGES